jgi:hypothetical protein
MSNRKAGDNPVVESKPSNGGKNAIEASAPYTVELKIEGIADILFHRWNCEAVEAKASAAKNSKAKKTDDVETYVYRLDDEDKASNLAIPGEYMRRSLCEAGRFKQDPRSPRKSMLDLCKASLIMEDMMADLGVSTWDYIHKGRVVIQRNAITRSRPAMRAGWKAKFRVTVLCPEYVSEDILHSLASDAGRLIGLADFRPSFGRFKIVGWEVLSQE